jgi:hypothetical protein
MLHRFVLAVPLFLVGCAADTADGDVAESDLIGDSASEILGPYSGRGPQTGESADQKPCTMTIAEHPGGTESWVSIEYDANEPGAFEVPVKAFQSKLLSRELVHSFITPKLGDNLCFFEGPNCIKHTTTLEYDTAKRITLIRAHSSDGPKDLTCAFQR